MGYLKMRRNERNRKDAKSKKCIKLSLLVKSIFSLIQLQTNPIAHNWDFIRFIDYGFGENRCINPILGLFKSY